MVGRHLLIDSWGYMGDGYELYLAHTMHCLRYMFNFPYDNLGDGNDIVWHEE